MAIYHCEVKIGGRSKGQSAVAASAYRSGTRMMNAETGQISDFTKKKGVVHSEVSLCANAPKEYADREMLWNAVHEADKKANARLWREIEVALPREFSREEQIDAVRDFVKGLVNRGMCADWSLHDTGDGNPHAHIMLTMRAIREDGTWVAKCRSVNLLDENGQRIPLIDKTTGKQKVDRQNRKQWKSRRVNTTDWDDKERVEEWRAEWESVCNRRLAPEAKIDHRSYKRQGKDLVPTIHEGYVPRKIERNGDVSYICQKNRDIQALNLSRSQPTLAEEIKKAEEKAETLRKIVKSNQAKIDHEPKFIEALETYLSLKSVEDKLNELKTDKKKQRYEKRHAKKLEAFRKAKKKLSQRFGSDEEAFPSDPLVIKDQSQQAAEKIENATKDLQGVEALLHELQLKKAASIQLERPAAIVFQKSLKQSGCWCEEKAKKAIDSDDVQVVQFDKTDAAALRLLHDLFPYIDIPVDIWGKQAEDFGYQNPMKAQIETGNSRCPTMTLAEYLTDPAILAPEKSPDEEKPTGRVTFSRKDRANAKAELDAIHNSQSDRESHHHKDDRER